MFIGTKKLFTLRIEGYTHTLETDLVQIHICVNDFTNFAAVAVLKQLPYLQSSVLLGLFPVTNINRVMGCTWPADGNKQKEEGDTVSNALFMRTSFLSSISAFH